MNFDQKQNVTWPPPTARCTPPSHILISHRNPAKSTQNSWHSSVHSNPLARIISNSLFAHRMTRHTTSANTHTSSHIFHKSSARNKKSRVDPPLQGDCRTKTCENVWASDFEKFTSQFSILSKMVKTGVFLDSYNEKCRDGSYTPLDAGYHVNHFSSSRRSLRRVWNVRKHGILPVWWLTSWTTFRECVMWDSSFIICPIEEELKIFGEIVVMWFEISVFLIVLVTLQFIWRDITNRHTEFKTCRLYKQRCLL